MGAKLLESRTWPWHKPEPLWVAQAAGKNMDCHRQDWDAGIFDPACAADVQPLRFWATAIWEGWPAMANVWKKLRWGGRHCGLASVSGRASANIA